MGPVQRAIKAQLVEGLELHTPAADAPFWIGPITDEGLVLLLGAQRSWTLLRWDCLEGLAAWLSGRGWVPIGTRYEVEGTPGTLDGYLKGCTKRATAGWVAATFERAGIVEIRRIRPVHVRLSAAFDSDTA
jgi:hypothetical protein